MDENLSEYVPVSDDPFSQHGWVVDKIELDSTRKNVFYCGVG